MTNDFNQIDGDSEFRDNMTLSCDEVSPEAAPDAHLEMDYEDRVSGCDGEQEPDQGWSGDGSGEDDFADYNANEADDYRDE